jgi:hypothetical protein
MWRMLFLAIGLASLVLGGELLAIDQATITIPAKKAHEPGSLMETVHASTHSREFVPPEWAPWALLSAGAITVMYTASVSRD